MWWPACGTQWRAQVWSTGSILMDLWHTLGVFVLSLGNEKKSVLQKPKGLLDLCVCSRLYRFELTSKCRSLIPLMCVFWGKGKWNLSSTEKIWWFLLFIWFPLCTFIPFSFFLFFWGGIHFLKLFIIYRGRGIGSFKLKWNRILPSSQKRYIMCSTTDFFISSIPQDAGIQSVLQVSLHQFHYLLRHLDPQLKRSV